MTYRVQICAGRREPLSGRASLGFVSLVSCKTHLARLCQERPPDGGHRLRQQTSGGDPSFSGGYHRLFPQKEMGVHIFHSAAGRCFTGYAHRLLPQTFPLAVPKNFGGMRLEIFDRGAVPRSLFRPLGALRGLRPLRGEKLLPKEGIFLISTAVVRADSRFQYAKAARPFALCAHPLRCAPSCGSQKFRRADKQVEMWKTFIGAQCDAHAVFLPGTKKFSTIYGRGLFFNHFFSVLISGF